MDVRNLTIGEVQSGLRNKQFSAMEVATAALSYAEAENPKTNAYLRFCPERALSMAASVDARIAAGEPIGLIDPALLSAEYSAYVDAGVWPKGAPVDGKDYDASIAKALYGPDGKVIWPTS